MSMATIQFYKNRYDYPHYSNNITTYGASMPCTPVGINLRTGTIRVKGNMSDFMSCNYMSLTRDNNTLYAWIDDVKFSTAESFEVTYTVDAWRTYKDKINLGTQYIARSPAVTYLPDNLLGSDEPQPTAITHNYVIGDSARRVFVVQMRPDVGTPFSITPVQPSPYQFFVTEYHSNNWLWNDGIEYLMSIIADNAETDNIVTMYSVPWFSTAQLPDQTMYVKAGGNTMEVDGFKIIPGYTQIDPSILVYNETSILFPGVDRREIMRTAHSIQVVIPEAGVINVPDELFLDPTLKLRQDIDLFTGASNYMLKTGNNSYYSHSVRGASVASIPIVSDPLDTYISQNQNALVTSLIGDVATIAGGAFASVGSGGVGAVAGAGAMVSGVRSMTSRLASVKDAGNRYSNPPAFLGTALAANFNSRFWTVITYDEPSNENQVHSNYGYAYNMVDTLTFPSSGFIQTEGCSVYSTDGSVPRWAIEEINRNFDNGIYVH